MFSIVPVSPILLLIVGARPPLIIQHDRQPVADVRFRVSLKPLARILGENELVSQPPVWLCIGEASRRSEPRTTGRPGHQQPPGIRIVPTRAFDQFRIQRQNAAVLRASFFLGRKRTVFHFVKLEHGRGLQNLLDSGRIVHAGQLHQDLAFAFLTAPRDCTADSAKPSPFTRVSIVLIVRCTVRRRRSIASVCFMVSV